MRHPFTSRLYRFIGYALLLAGMFLCIRLADYFWNSSIFSELSKKELLLAWLIGLRFDASALAHLMIVPFVITVIPLPESLSKKRWYVVSLFLFLVAGFLFVLGWVDIELVRFVKARMTKSTLFLFKEGDFTVSDLLKNYAGLLLISFFAWFVWAYFILRMGFKGANSSNDWQSFSFERPSRFSFHGLILFLMLLALIVIGVRGGIRNSKPLRVVDTYPDLNVGNWALNTPFVFIKELRSSSNIEKVYFGDVKKIRPYLNGSDKEASALDGLRFEKPQNVVIFMMESFGQDVMGKINQQKGYTPFVDELAQESLFFHESYANATRSIEGVPAVLGGIPAWGSDPFLVSPYANAEFDGLGKILSQRGYETAFFHGGKKGTMFLDQFAIRAGFKEHFSKENYPYPEDIDSSWGVFDEPYFQYVANQLDNMHKKGPFAVGVFSLTAHFPFHLPEKYKDTLPEGPIPVLKTQAYADLALKHFFETAKTKPWFNDTLFIITADHATEVHLEEYKKDPLGRWRIPVIYYHPKMNWPHVNTNRPIQQIDILPSVLDFLGIVPNRVNLLGRSVFKDGERVVTIRTKSGFYSLSDDVVLYEALNDDKVEAFVRKTNQKASSIPQDLLLKSHAAIEFYQSSMKNRMLYQKVP